MNAMTWAKTLAAIGSILLIGCIVWMAREIPPPVTSIGCRESLKVELADQTQKDRDNAGNLRIVGVSPKSVTLGSRLCIVVAGVAAAATEAQNPAPTPPASVAVNLFLNEVLTKLSANAAPVPGPQMLTYQFGEHA